MIGKIVVFLLVVVCFSCILTEAQTFGSLPTFNESIITQCDSYTPIASFARISEFAYVEEFSGLNLDCLTLDIQPEMPTSSGVFTSTYYYNINGTLSSQQSILVENPRKHGQGQSYMKNSDGTYTFTRLTVIVGSENGTNGLDGYDLVSCTADGVKQAGIFLTERHPQSGVVSDLKNQLNAIGLQGVQLNVIYQGDTCVYFQASKSRFDL